MDRRIASLLLFFTFMAGYGLKPAPAEAQKPYYKGKTIQIVVGSSAGGGTDTVARLTARFLPKYLSGKPRIAVRNRPGGSGTIALNDFYARAKPNGLYLSQASSSQVSMQLTKMDIAKYDLTKTPAIANVVRGGAVLMLSKKAKKRLTDPGGEPVICGTRAGDEPWVAIPMWGREFLGWNVRWILGFSGHDEIGLAIRRGEIDMFATQNARIINDLVDEGVAEPITQTGFLRKGKFMRRPDYPNVPTFVEVLGDKKPTGTPWQGWMAFMGSSLVDKMLVAPPGTPDKIVNSLTGAYAKMVKDPKYDSMVKKMISEVYSVSIGKDSTALLMDILAAPPEAIEYSKKLQIKFGILK